MREASVSKVIVGANLFAQMQHFDANKFAPTVLSYQQSDIKRDEMSQRGPHERA